MFPIVKTFGVKTLFFFLWFVFLSCVCKLVFAVYSSADDYCIPLSLREAVSCIYFLCVSEQISFHKMWFSCKDYLWTGLLLGNVLGFFLFLFIKLNL